MISLGTFMCFGLLYNAVCVNCMGLPGSYWVMQVAIGRHLYWLTVFICAVLAVLPRLVQDIKRCTECRL